jgi:peroxiredoxin
MKSSAYLVCDLGYFFGYFRLSRWLMRAKNADGKAKNASTATHPRLACQRHPIFGLTLPDSNGQAQALEQWRGKILVVNYWATWCPPCREEMPGFSRLQAKFAAKGVQFVGISIDTAVKVTEFQKETPVNYPLLIGDAGAIDSSVALGNSRQALPFTAVIDRQGRVSAVKLGRFTEADLEPELIELVSRSPQWMPSPKLAPGT